MQFYACGIHRQYSHKAGDIQFSSGNKMLFLCTCTCMVCFYMVCTYI